MSYRPRGVTALSVTLIVLAALGVITAVAIEFMLTRSSSMIINSIFSYFSIISLFSYYFYPLTPEEMEILTFLLLFGTVISVSSTLSFISYLHLATFLLLIGAVLYIVAAFGLLKMKSWGRYLGLEVGMFNIIVGIIGLVAIGGIIPLIFGIVILVYLGRDVKYEFQESQTVGYRPEGIIF